MCGIWSGSRILIPWQLSLIQDNCGSLGTWYPFFKSLSCRRYILCEWTASSNIMGFETQNLSNVGLTFTLQISPHWDVVEYSVRMQVAMTQVAKFSCLSLSPQAVNELASWQWQRLVAPRDAFSHTNITMFLYIPAFVYQGTHRYTSTSFGLILGASDPIICCLGTGSEGSDHSKPYSAR